MKLWKMLFIAGLAIMTVILGSGFQVYGVEPPPTEGTIQGPELWGVVILDCQSPEYLAIRVKRIVNCNVEVQTIVVPDSVGCPNEQDTIPDDEEPLNRRFGSYKDQLFGITGTPIITKVKNFQRETYTYTVDGNPPSQAFGKVVTFDAQIKFWVPPATP